MNGLPLEQPSRGAMMEMADALKEDPASALRMYEEAVSAYPESAYVLMRAAKFLVMTEEKQLRDAKRAIVWARKAAQLTKEGNGYVLDVLAVALHEDGQLEEAVRIAQRAAELARDKEVRQRARDYAEELKNRK